MKAVTRWSRKRQYIYERDYGRCRYCDHEISFYEATFDHVLPKSHGGRGSPKNLVLACRRCNALKGSHMVGPIFLSSSLTYKDWRKQWLLTIAERKKTDAPKPKTKPLIQVPPGIPEWMY